MKSSPNPNTGADPIEMDEAAAEESRAVSHNIRVLVADDNDLFRQGLVSLLRECDSVVVVGEARDGHQAIAKTEILRPDVILMDVSMPRMDGVAATQQIAAEHPGVQVAMLTAYEDDELLFAAVRSGARSYLAKSVPLDQLETAIKTIAGGGTVVSPHLAHRLLEEFARMPRNDASAHRETEQLTPREHDVLELVAQGLSNKEIAAELVIAENTVKVHLRNMLDKLHLRNRQQAAALAVQEGIVTDIRGEAFARL